MAHCYPDSVECLIENLIQSSYEYEQAEGSSAKYLRGEFSKAKHALREHIAQLQYETGMYKSLYDNAISGVAQKAVNRDETDHIDWDILAEERLGQRPRSEHGRHIPQTSPAPGCDSGSHSAQGAKEPTVDELGGYIEHGLCYGISSKDGRIAARCLLAQFDIRAKGSQLPSTSRCTCAAIVNPNIPHARTCPLSSTVSNTPEGK